MRTPRSDEGADEAAEALLEGDDGLRDLEVVEGVAAGRGDGVGAGFHDGVGGDGEGELVDDDAAELFALHVDSLPEGLDVPKRTALGVSRNCWRRMWRGAEPCMSSG